MKLTRRGALGAVLAAPMAAAIPQSPSPLGYRVGGTLELRPQDVIGETSVDAKPDLAYWRERKRWAEKILAGDFSDIELTRKEGVRYSPYPSYADLDCLKSLSLAAKQMIIKQREIDASKKSLIRDAMNVLDTCKKLFGFNLGKLFDPNG